MIDRQKLDSQLMLDEGLRLIAYKDRYGNLTTGVGRNLDSNPLTAAEIAVVGHDARTLPITHDDAIYLLHNDEGKVLDWLTAQYPWWTQLDDVRGRVMVDLCFNLGWAKFSQFKQFLEFMFTSRFTDAASDLQATAWYSEVGNRGPRLVGMVMTGEDYTA